MRNINRFSIVGIVLFTTFPLACQVKEEVVAKVNGEPIYLSEVEKMKESLNQQYYNYSLTPPSNQDLTRTAIDRIIEEKILKQQADKEKIKVFDWEVKREIDNLKKSVAMSEGIDDLSSPKVETSFMEKLKAQNMSIDQLKEDLKKKILIEKLINQKVKPLIEKPSEEELKKFFNDIVAVSKKTHNMNFSSEDEKEFYTNLAERMNEIFGERVRYRQIVIKPLSYSDLDKKKAEEKASLLRQRIIEGEDFEDIAAKESADSLSAKNGGDMGYVFRGNLPPSLEGIVFSLNVGEISKPVWTDFGCHIIQVTEKKIAEKPKFEKIKRELENLLFQKRLSEELERYIKELKKSSSIEIFQR
ncbi:MAG: peptidylprolyl isomerase [Elusimicrobiales bacterium]